MRLFTNLCQKRNCNNNARMSFRFCYKKNCGVKKGDEEE
jgi:hypothetical protein